MPEPKPHPGMTPRYEKQLKPDAKAARFAARDKNGDGRLDREEFAATAVAKGTEAIAARFRKLDRDEDGNISRDEFLNEE